MNLQLFLEEAEDGARDDPAHATAVDAQHGDDAPVGRRRRLGRAQRRRRRAAAERPPRHRVQRQAGAGAAGAGELPSIHRRHGRHVRSTTYVLRSLDHRVINNQTDQTSVTSLARRKEMLVCAVGY